MTDSVIQVYYYTYWFSMYLFLKITEISNSNCVFVCFSCSYTSFCFMEFEAVNCIKEQSWRPYTTWFQDLLSYSNKTGWYWYRNRSKKKKLCRNISTYICSTDFQQRCQEIHLENVIFSKWCLNNWIVHAKKWNNLHNTWNRSHTKIY